MIKEVREQAKVFADILRTRSKIADVARELSKRNPRSYYAVGCGSSYYAAMIGIFYHEYVFGLDSRALPSSEFVWYTPVNSPPSVLMALSRSGKTSETVGATRKARKMQIPTVAITSEPTSTMGTECDYCLNIQIGDEQSVVMTKSFTASTLLSILLGYEISRVQGKGPKDFEEKLAQLPSDADIVIRTVEDQAKRAADLMRNLSRFIYLGSGPNYGACVEGALKLRETSYSACEAYHALEIRHGPFAQLQKDIGVIAVVPEDKAINQSEMLLKEMASTGATVIPISNIPKIVNSYENSIRLPETISTDFMSLLSVIPMQMLAFHYAVGRGLNPDLPRNLTRFVTTDLGQ
jgi:glucosamine--fructose-6-phosphate aminotransferase (isomerizing)